MTAQPALWRTSDIVTYDTMREASVALQARLLEAARNGSESARAELAEVRARTFDVDGYDRAAVETFTAHLTARLAELDPDNP